MLTVPQADYDSQLINKMEGREPGNGTSLHCLEPPGTFIGIVYYASLIIILSFNLSLFHMQPGIIAGDEVTYNHGYIMSRVSIFFADFVTLNCAVIILLVMVHWVFFVHISFALPCALYPYSEVTCLS